MSTPGRDAQAGLDTIVELTAARSHRRDTTDLLQRVGLFLAEVGKRAGARWLTLNRRYSWDPLRTLEDLRGAMAMAALDENATSTAIGPRLLRLDLRPATRRGEDATVLLRATLLTLGDEAGSPWRLELTIVHHKARPPARFISPRELLSSAVPALAPSWAWAHSRTPVRRGLLDSAPRVGWLTYISSSLGPLPAVPPPTETQKLGDMGWLFVAQPEPVDESRPEHRACLAYVRQALGARVLLDGPSFAPPNEPKATAEAAAEPAPYVVPQVPSYLKDPPPPVHDESAVDGAPPLQAAASPRTPTTWPTETTTIDLSQLLKGPLPFDSSETAQAATGSEEATAAASSPSSARAGVPSGTSALDIAKLMKPAIPFEERSRSPAADSAPPSNVGELSKETTEVNVAALMKRAVPFGAGSKEASADAAAREPETAAAGTSGAASQSGRAEFGGTEEFTLADLAKRGAVIPFGPRHAEPTTAELPTLADFAEQRKSRVSRPATARGRWIRFNPQTGEPLETPYWEELPGGDKK